MTFILELVKGKGESEQRRFCTCNNATSLDDALKQAGMLIHDGWKLATASKYPTLRAALDAANLSSDTNSMSSKTSRSQRFQAKKTLHLADVANQRLQELQQGHSRPSTVSAITDACESIESALLTCESPEEVAAVWGTLADATCTGVSQVMGKMKGSVEIPRFLLEKTFVHVDHALSNVHGYGMKMHKPPKTT